MAITNGYITLAELKRRMDLSIGSTANDADMEATITAVSRLIDQQTHRRFYTTDSDETRYYTADERNYLMPGDDIISITALYTDNDGNRTYEYTWAATDYDLCPVNAALDGEPYTWLETAPNGDYVFPSTPRGVKVVGKFGYSATTPALVKEACLLQCQRVWKRRDAPFGVTGPNEFGQQTVITRLDPDVVVLLEPITRYG
jgi:hypothetical protein